MLCIHIEQVQSVRLNIFGPTILGNMGHVPLAIRALLSLIVWLRRSRIQICLENGTGPPKILFSLSLHIKIFTIKVIMLETTSSLFRIFSEKSDMCQVTQITGLAPQAGLCMVGWHLSWQGCSGIAKPQLGRDGHC